MRAICTNLRLASLTYWKNWISRRKKRPHLKKMHEIKEIRPWHGISSRQMWLWTALWRRFSLSRGHSMNFSLSISWSLRGRNLGPRPPVSCSSKMSGPQGIQTWAPRATRCTAWIKACYLTWNPLIETKTWINTSNRSCSMPRPPRHILNFIMGIVSHKILRLEGPLHRGALAAGGSGSPPCLVRNEDSSKKCW